MKIALYSDLHLEIDDFEPSNSQGADVLILAGDIMVADYLTRNPPSPYCKLADIFISFLEKCSNLFPYVLYVAGNHEHYHGDFEKTVGILKDVLPDNIHLLDNDIIEIDGIRFGGGTLWTNLSNPIAAMHVQNGLNDYKVIKKNYRRLIPTDTTSEHFITTDFIGNNDIDVVITHHSPSEQSVSGKFAGDILNAGYFTNLEHMMDDGVKLWVHGHMHNSVDYMVGSTRVVANPKGYRTENSEGFHQEFIITL